MTDLLKAAVDLRKQRTDVRQELTELRDTKKKMEEENNACSVLRLQLKHDEALFNRVEERLENKEKELDNLNKSLNYLTTEIQKSTPGTPLWVYLEGTRHVPVEGGEWDEDEKAWRYVVQHFSDFVVLMLKYMKGYEHFIFDLSIEGGVVYVSRYQDY